MNVYSTLKKCQNALGKITLVTLIGTWSAMAGGPAKLPDFTITDLDGKPWSSSQLRGKAVVIDFWATWCVTCKETIPALAELHAKHNEKGLVVIGISVDKGSVEKVRKGAAKMGITYLVLHDKDNSLSKPFGFTGIPSVYVFDRSGNSTFGMPGFDPDHDDELIAGALKAMEGRASPMATKSMSQPMEEVSEPATAPAVEEVAKPMKAKPKATSTAKPKKAN